MKKILHCLLTGLVLAVLGCTPPETQVQITTSQPTLTLLPETQTPLAVVVAETPLLATPVTSAPPPASPTPALPLTTNAPSTSETEAGAAPEATEEFRATKIPISTSIPLSTVPFEPFTQGSVLFLWNEALPPTEEGPSGFEPTVNLYLARPGTTAAEWEVQRLVSGIRQLARAFLSPDQTKLALLSYDPAAGSILQIYELDNGSRTQIGDTAYRDSLSWLEDSQSIVYPQGKDIFWDRLDGLPAQSLTNYPTPSSGESDGFIRELIGSPNGRFQALYIFYDSLVIFDVESQETHHIIDGFSGRDDITFQWSPDSQWMAFTRDQYLSLFVVDTNNFTVSELATEPTAVYHSSWSPDGRWLAFTQSSILSLWDSETATTKDLASASYVGEPAWSSDGATIAFGFVEAEKFGIRLLDLVNSNQQELVLGIAPTKIYWSPDGQWLLFLGWQNEQTGLYIVNRNGDVPYLILDVSSELHVPDYITWLSPSYILP